MTANAAAGLLLEPGGRPGIENPTHLEQTVNHTDPTAAPLRERVLVSMDFNYVASLGYSTPEELLAAYDDSRAAVVSRPTSRAAWLAAATCSAQYHGPGEDTARLCIRAAQHTGKAHTDEHGFHWSDTVAMYPVADGTFRTGINVQAELRRLAAEAQQQTDTEAHPPTITWKVESPRRDNWASWGSTYDEHDWAREMYEHSTSNAPARRFRLVRATTTYTVEAEYTPPAPVQQPAAADDEAQQDGGQR